MGSLILVLLCVCNRNLASLASARRQSLNAAMSDPNNSVSLQADIGNLPNNSVALRAVAPIIQAISANNVSATAVVQVERLLTRVSTSTENGQVRSPICSLVSDPIVSNDSRNGSDGVPAILRV